MIKITVELYPHGFSENKRLLAVGYIANDGSGSKSVGNYRIKLMGKNGKRLYRKGTVTGFPRLKQGVWRLLHLALTNIFSEEKK